MTGSRDVWLVALLVPLGARKFKRESVPFGDNKYPLQALHVSCRGPDSTSSKSANTRTLRKNSLKGDEQ